MLEQTLKLIPRLYLARWQQYNHACSSSVFLHMLVKQYLPLNEVRVLVLQSYHISHLHMVQWRYLRQKLRCSVSLLHLVILFHKSARDQHDQYYLQHGKNDLLLLPLHLLLTNIQEYLQHLHMDNFAY